MRLSLIAAIGKNKEIGLYGKLPWYLPSDLRHFKNLTTNSGNTIIMGRTTHESIGRALPNRTNIVLTHNPDYSAPGCLVAATIESALAQVSPTETEAFFIGGAGIYAIALEFVDRLYLTEVDYAGPADVFFPNFDHAQWLETSRETPPLIEKDEYPFSFIIYDRKSNIKNHG